MIRITLFALLLTFSFACGKQLSVEEQLQVDIEIIEDYLKENNLEAETTDSGLHYIIVQQGSGAEVLPNSIVTVRYKGYFTDGTIFDQSDSFQTGLSQVIRGWTEGIPKFREGGEGVLLIPSKLGYGPNGGGSIPGNKVILFDVKVLEVNN